VSAAINAMPNVGTGGVSVVAAQEVVTTHETTGVLNLLFNVTFDGDGVRGDLASLVVATNHLANTTKRVFVTDLSVRIDHNASADYLKEKLEVKGVSERWSERERDGVCELRG